VLRRYVVRSRVGEHEKDLEMRTGLHLTTVTRDIEARLGSGQGTRSQSQLERCNDALRGKFSQI
jgi:hypothetical protein